MPREKDPGKKKKEEAPRTDLPPLREPYYEGYFGTDEEEGVEREQANDAEGDGEREDEGQAEEPES